MLNNLLIDIVLNMEGAITWDDVWGISPHQRQLIIEKINKRNKEIKKQLTGKEQM